MTVQQLMIGEGGGPTAIGAITAAGLTSNLVLCLDAGDAASYTSGTKWLDTSGNGYDFDITAATFTGSAGVRQSYFALGGSSYFTYDSANEAWMNNLHKDNALFTLAWFVYPTSVVTNKGYIGTDGNDNTKIGMQFSNAGALIVVNADGGSGAFAGNPISTPGSANAWNMIALVVNESGGVVSFLWVNGTTGTLFDAAYTSPSASSASYAMQIGAAGNNIDPLDNGSRIGICMAWTTALTGSNLTSIWNLLRPRYGI